MKRSHAIGLLMLVLTMTSAKSQTAEHGTTFAVERTPELVAVAIDSSNATIDTSTSKEIQNGPKCKVHMSSGVVFVVAGIYQYQSDHHLAFDAVKTVGRILASNVSWQQIEPKMTTALGRDLKHALADPGLSWKFPNGSSVLQVAMAGGNSQIPYLHAIEFLVHYVGTRPVLDLKIVSCPGDCPTGYKNLAIKPPGMRVTGHAELDTKVKVGYDISHEADLAIREHRDKELIGPAQLATIDALGNFRWVNRPDFCPMVPSY